MLYLVAETTGIKTLSPSSPSSYSHLYVGSMYDDIHLHVARLYTSSPGSLFVSKNSTHFTPFADRRGYPQWPSSLVWTCPKKRCEKRQPQSDGPGNTKYQTRRTPQEDMIPTDQRRHDGRRCYPGYDPGSEGVEKKDKADP